MATATADQSPEPPFQRSSPTSKADAVRRTAPTLQQHALDALGDAGGDGLIIEQLVDEVSTRRGSLTKEGAICGRVHELRAVNLVVAANRTRKNRSGVEAQVWVLASIQDGGGAVIAKNAQPNHEPLNVDAAAAARLVGVSRSGWWKLHSSGKCPLPHRLGRRTLWRVAELEAWVAAGCPPRGRWETLRGRSQEGSPEPWRACSNQPTSTGLA